MANAPLMHAYRAVEDVITQYPEGARLIKSYEACRLRPIGELCSAGSMRLWFNIGFAAKAMPVP